MLNGTHLNPFSSYRTIVGILLLYFHFLSSSLSPGTISTSEPLRPLMISSLSVKLPPPLVVLELASLGSSRIRGLVDFEEEEGRDEEGGMMGRGEVETSWGVDVS